MNTNSFFDLTQLAEASYGDFWDEDSSQVITHLQDVKTALQRIGTDDGEPDDSTDGFSVTQSEEFVMRWDQERGRSPYILSAGEHQGAMNRIAG